MQCAEFPKMLTKTENAAWCSFVAVVEGFLGNNRDKNYARLVQTLERKYICFQK